MILTMRMRFNYPDFYECTLSSDPFNFGLNLGDDDNAQEILTNNRSRLATFYEAKIKKNRLLTGNYSELDSEFTS